MSTKESHSFSVSVACSIGIHCAIVLQHFIFLQKSVSGTWVKKSNKAFRDTYPYLSEKEIRGAIDRLERDGMIVSKIDNDVRADRTKSYFVTSKGCALYGLEPFALLSNGTYQRANATAERANDILPKGQMNIEVYSNYYNNNVVSENAPAPENSVPLKTEEKNPLPQVPPAPLPAAPRWDDYPKANTPDELLTALRCFYFPDNKPAEHWRVLIDATPAMNWTPAKQKEVVSNFCDWALGEGWERRTFKQINARLKRWFKDEPLMAKQKQPGGLAKPSGEPAGRAYQPYQL